MAEVVKIVCAYCGELAIFAHEECKITQKEKLKMLTFDEVAMLRQLVKERKELLIRRLGQQEPNGPYASAIELDLVNLEKLAEKLADLSGEK